jgi:hypothetical protein
VRTGNSAHHIKLNYSRSDALECVFVNYFAYRIGIFDVCRSIAEANMGGDFYIKAVTRYAVLADVFLFFLFSNKKTCFKKFSNFFFRFGFWAEGLWMNAQNPKLLIGLLLIYNKCIYFINKEMDAS